MKRVFVAYFFLVGWDSISLGFNIGISQPNIEIHLPFGFIRIGWVKTTNIPAKNQCEIDKKIFGKGC